MFYAYHVYGFLNIQKITSKILLNIYYYTYLLKILLKLLGMFICLFKQSIHYLLILHTICSKVGYLLQIIV